VGIFLAQTTELVDRHVAKHLGAHLTTVVDRHRDQRTIAAFRIPDHVCHWRLLHRTCKPFDILVTARPSPDPKSAVCDREA
jgi:hypothetical protein